jgi:ribosome-associated toxin RatA of RatAB toxin-antitoxin module
MAKVVWAKGERFERKTRFMVPARAEEVFPLLCPVREYEWIPDWRCRMIYSKSGVAEKDAVFTTLEKPFGKVLWTCVVYEPPYRVEYLLARGSMASIRLELELSDEGGRCAVDWTMRFTAASPLFAALLRRKMSEKAFTAMMMTRERQLAEYFSRRKPMPSTSP